MSRRERQDGDFDVRRSARQALEAHSRRKFASLSANIQGILGRNFTGSFDFLAMPCLQFRDLLFGCLFQPILKISIVLVRGKQLQAPLFGGESEIVLPGGKISIAQAILRIGRRGIRFGVQLE